MLVERNGDYMKMEAVYESEIEFTPGSEKRLDIDLGSMPVTIRVLRAGGAEPATDASVELIGTGGPSRGVARNDGVDETGSVTMDAFVAGDFRIIARSAAFGAGRAECTLPSAGPVVVTLEPGVPCRGTLAMSDDLAGERAVSELLLTFGEGADEYAIWESNVKYNRRVEFAEDARAFEIEGLAPGRYEVRLRRGERLSGSIPFELPANGRTDLRLDFKSG
jgi:hypothetical protein